MHRPPARTISGTRRGTTSAWPAHQGLAGPHRTRINRPAGNRTGRTVGRHPRPRRRRCTGSGRLRQPRDHVRPGRNDRSRRRLPGQIRFRGRPQRAASADRSGGSRRKGRARSNGSHGSRPRSWRRNAGNGRRGDRSRARYAWRRRRRNFRQLSEIRGKRLAGTRKDLSWPGSWHGPRRNRRSAQHRGHGWRGGCGQSRRRGHGSRRGGCGRMRRWMNRMSRRRHWMRSGASGSGRQWRTEWMRRPRRAAEIFVSFPGWFKDSSCGIDFQVGPSSRFWSGGSLRTRRVCGARGRGFFDGRGCGIGAAIVGRIRTSGDALANLKGDIVIERTGVGLLVGDA